MDLQRLIDFCATRPGATLEFPFGPTPACYKWGGRIFAEVYPDPEHPKVTLRCEPEFGALVRDRWPDAVVPGYRVPLRQRRFKNTVLLDRGLPEDEVLALVVHAHATVSAVAPKLPTQRDR
ncbi:MAG TPA: MmcQ/YjbR family DNA-binding protein [Spirochaetia bacterium]|nr:MmcQ/YjbR family DNA-binding protein [Spirochaetia bacterium]